MYFIFEIDILPGAQRRRFHEAALKVAGAVGYYPAFSGYGAIMALFITADELNRLLARYPELVSHVKRSLTIDEAVREDFPMTLLYPAKKARIL